MSTETPDWNEIALFVQFTNQPCYADAGKCLNVRNAIQEIKFKKKKTGLKLLRTHDFYELQPTISIPVFLFVAYSQPILFQLFFFQPSPIQPTLTTTRKETPPPQKKNHIFNNAQLHNDIHPSVPPPFSFVCFFR